MKDKTICIVCPKGCEISYESTNGNFTGNKCKRGEEFIKQELLTPKRDFSTTIKILHSDMVEVLPLRSTVPIELKKMSKIIDEVNQLYVSASVEINDIIFEKDDVVLIACRSIEKRLPVHNR